MHHFVIPKEIEDAWVFASIAQGIYAQGLHSLAADAQLQISWV